LLMQFCYMLKLFLNDFSNKSSGNSNCVSYERLDTNTKYVIMYNNCFFEWSNSLHLPLNRQLDVLVQFLLVQAVDNGGSCFVA
jgi:hypothetical protein